MSGPLYSFNTNVPQAAQLIRITQQPIENNFQAINELINVNHVGFQDPINYGKHTFTSLPSQGSSPTTVNNEMSVFCAPSAGANPYEIYYRYPNNGDVVQLTGSTGGSSSATTPGYTYLSSTVFMMWASASVSSSTSNVITFPTGGGFPTFTEVYHIQYCPKTSYTNFTNAVYISAVTTTNFTFRIPSSNYATSIYWMAIGV